MGLMEPASGESCHSGQRRDLAAPREDKFTTPGLEILQYLYNSNNPGTKTVIARVDTAPQRLEIPTSLALS